ncbi:MULTISPECIES: vWA domain-containing protein [unclassified Rhizobium]|uniref:vWA domain-containing protein n=1 Tax=unclassified Rhizobium TaxID=2613769 RepID=UPI000AFE2990|nr:MULTISPECIES: VWA domain-containing protein [unclassified Rhizobium]
MLHLVSAAIRSFFCATSGNIGIMAAMIMPVALGAGGVSIDASNIMWAKSTLQNATDAAALAAASGLANEHMSVDEAKRQARVFLSTRMIGAVEALSSTGSEARLGSPDVTIASESTGVGTGKRFVVSVKSDFAVPLTPLSRILGATDMTVHAESESKGQTATESSLSMFLVLDKSGSMNEATNKKGVNKLQSLKLAVEGLLAQLTKADPNGKYVRTAAIAYNNKEDAPSGLSWDEGVTLAYVKKLASGGSTDSSGAMKTAYAALTGPAETAEHVAMTGLTPKRFLVLMTDGDNTAAKNDTDTKAVCDKARSTQTTVYTVAFMAPAKGKSLLSSCATTSANFFQAEDADALIAAFASIGRDASMLAVRLTK